tara:strand:- start:301 stop:498 length:198 start_codon:yes stop_codon:yes gene_type:complete
MTKSKNLENIIYRLTTLNKTELINLLSHIEAELLFRDKKYIDSIGNKIQDMINIDYEKTKGEKNV